MTILMQISDPHFGTEQPPVVEALKRLAWDLRPDVAALSGDITQRARPAQFRAARAFVDQLNVPVVLAIPGNHDIPLFNVAARVLAPYANHMREFGRELEPSHESARMLVLTVNTTRPHRHKNGEVSAAQVERSAARLARARPEQLRVVVVHQPVAVVDKADEKNLLRGREAAVAAWARAGADVVLGGHIHLPFVVPLHERDPSLPRRLWAVQAGTAVSWRVRSGAPNSVNLVYSGDASPSTPWPVVERWDYADALQAFRRVESHELHTGPTR